MREGRMLFDVNRSTYIHWWRSDDIVTIFTLRFMSIRTCFLHFGVLDQVVMFLEAGLCSIAWVIFKWLTCLAVKVKVRNWRMPRSIN